MPAELSAAIKKSSPVAFKWVEVLTQLSPTNAQRRCVSAWLRRGRKGMDGSVHQRGRDKTVCARIPETRLFSRRRGELDRWVAKAWKLSSDRDRGGVCDGGD